ncbi:MAG: hypothetical protein MHM6MM_005637 [Cercozoa sp. M6MM]
MYDRRDDRSHHSSRVSRSSSAASLSRAALSAEDFAASGFEPARVAAASTHSCESSESPEAPVFRSVMTMDNTASSMAMPSMAMPSSMEMPGLGAMDSMLDTLMPSLTPASSVPGASLGVGMGLGLGLDMDMDMGMGMPSFGSQHSDGLSKHSVSGDASSTATVSMSLSKPQQQPQQQGATVTRQLSPLPAYVDQCMTLCTRMNADDTEQWLVDFAAANDGSMRSDEDTEDWDDFGDDDEDVMSLQQSPEVPQFELTLHEHTSPVRVTLALYAAPGVDASQQCCVEVRRAPSCTSCEVLQAKSMLSCALNATSTLADQVVGQVTGQMSDDGAEDSLRVDAKLIASLERCLEAGASLRPQVCKALCHLSSQVSEQEAPLLAACVRRASELSPQTRSALSGARSNLEVLERLSSQIAF